MASLGQLVAGVAHEINTPVGIGVTAASKLELRTKELAGKLKDGQVKKSDLDGYMNFAVEGCDMILKNLNRAAELIQSFKRVAVDQSADDERRINLHDYLHEVIVSISPSIKKSKVNVALTGATDLELVTSPSSLSQIVINLVMNALIHAFEGREEGVIRIAYEALPDKVLRLSITDNGRGIPPEVLPKIFDPFFTTNRSKGGSGLGLHIVYNLVAQNLKGDLKVESELGKGSTFVLTMPIIS
jgi:signal transduction histidine kinase